jgi:hypothetical protein
MAWALVGPTILLLTAVGFVLWDRRSPVSASPDMRTVWIGVVLAAIGVSSVFLWWLIVPVVLLLVGATMIVVGRHRVAAVA